MGWIRALILGCASTAIVAAQEMQPAQRSRGPSTLQLGTPIERTIAPGQAHHYPVTAEENSLVQITIEQRGIDVLVRIHSPVGNKVAEYDSPNGSDGAEDVSFVTASKLPYTIEVTPLSRDPGPAGRYEIRLIELRRATDQEIKESRSHEVLKARGLALLDDLDALIAELRSPQTRIKAQMQAAQLLWESDEKRASKYLTDALTGYQELLANVDLKSRDYTRKYHLVHNLRHELLQLLIARQPESALIFIRSTPPLPDPYGNRRDLSHEAAMELEIANRLAEKDPKRTLEIARENLKSSRYSSNLATTISQLRQKNPEMAADLANEVANKLLGEKLIKNLQAASLATNLIQISTRHGDHQGAETNGSPRRPPLLSDQLRRDLLQKAISEALGYKPPASNTYTPERDYAWTLLHGLKSLGAEVDTVSPGTAAAIEKKIKEFSHVTNNPQTEALQELQNAINDANIPIDDVIQKLTKAPREHKDQLYINLSNRALNNGDIVKAKQIVNDYVNTPFHRQQALYNIENQEMFRSMSKGKIDDALRNVANLQNAHERAQMISQLANQIGPGNKRATALQFLEQARGLLSGSAQAQDHVQMQALLEIAKAFSRYESKRAFEIFDPLVDQFNDISAAARTMEGFGGEYFEQEELNLQNGNAVANIATQMTQTLGVLALTNFDRAKLTAERIRLPEVRLRAYLDIAQQTIMNNR